MKMATKFTPITHLNLIRVDVLFQGYKNKCWSPIVGRSLNQIAELKVRNSVENCRNIVRD